MSGSLGSIVASTVWPRVTASPGSKSIRNRRPASGAATTYRSLIRVLPSSSTVTRKRPRVTAATSTSTGCGQNDHTRPPTIAADHHQEQKRPHQELHDPRHSLVFSTAIKSKWSSRSRTNKPEMAAPASTTATAKP